MRPSELMFARPLREPASPREAAVHSREGVLGGPLGVCEVRAMLLGRTLLFWFLGSGMFWETFRVLSAAALVRPSRPRTEDGAAWSECAGEGAGRWVEGCRVLAESARPADQRRMQGSSWPREPL